MVVNGMRLLCGECNEVNQTCACTGSGDGVEGVIVLVFRRDYRAAEVSWKRVRRVEGKGPSEVCPSQTMNVSIARIDLRFLVRAALFSCLRT